MPPIDALLVLPGQAGSVLTPQQKRFNTLVRQIEQARQTLGAWHDNIGAYGQAHVKVLLPLRTELAAARREWVFALDALLERRGWTKVEQGTLGQLVCEAASALLDADDDDVALKALFDRHAEVDYDTDRQQRMLTLKDMAEAMTGLDLGDDEGIDTDADLFERMQQRVQVRAAAEEAERGAKAANRGKTAAQQRREADARQATQSVREIFRKLASALHPDRETDATQREIKTALMQKVNQAYAADDLLTLLELQLQIEQIDASHIAGASAQRLKHYNQVLSEQLSELKTEITRVKMGFLIDFGLEPEYRLDPRKLGQVLERNSRKLRAELNQQQRAMHILADVPATKRWLKRERQQQLLREADFEFDLF